MKQTRRFDISERAFTSQDLLRIAAILDRQEQVGNSDDIRKLYSVRFDDDTQFESDSPEVFQEESLAAHGRPAAIEMSYNSYTENDYIWVFLTRGGSSSGRNEVVVSGSQPAWVNANFQSLKDAIDRVRPQQVWLRQHLFLLFSLIALGVGNIWFLLWHALGWFIRKRVGHDVLAGSPTLLVLPVAWFAGLSVLYTAIDWLVRWMVGVIMGGVVVTRWLLALWPSVEFNFGPPHLPIEKKATG